MKQVSNSLLTLCLNPFSSIPEAEAPRKTALANGRHLTPFFVHQGNKREHRSILLSLSCSPRSLVRSRLGEGRIRSLLYGMCLSLFVLLMLSVPVRNIAAADLIVTLKEEAAVESGKVLLKDIADLRGGDPAQLRKLEQLSLVQAPEFGSVTTLSREKIKDSIQSAFGPISSGVITGSPAVQIRLKGRQVSAADIEPILKSHFSESTSWKESEIEIRSIGNMKGIEIPLSGAELRLSSSATISGQRRILAPIEILQDGKNLRNFWVSAEICVRADVVTATRRIISGKIVTAEDIEIRNTEIADLRPTYAGRPEEVIGKVSRRNFSTGDPLTRDSFSDPYLVRNGETVRLRLERDGIVLTSLAKAEQDGRLGQIIRVRNIDFSRVLKAQVTGHAEVTVQ
jgi:flagellar basal body P-ring formation protein FlgA